MWRRFMSACVYTKCPFSQTRAPPVPVTDLQAGAAACTSRRSTRQRVFMTAPYMSGFGSHFASEAVAGALPQGRNSPQRPAFGLYAEQLSGTAFTAPRHENRRSWLYRMRPTADHPPFVAYEDASLFAAPPSPAPLTPNRLRWDPP